VSESATQAWKLFLRIPGWCQDFSIKVNGLEVSGDSQQGCITIDRLWKTNDVVEADFAMPAFFIEADPRVDSVRGCVAIQRGPIVYCLEEQDQSQGINLLDVKIDPTEEMISHWQGDLLGGVVTVEGTGYETDRSNWQNNGLYRRFILKKEDRHSERKVKLMAIPYYAWGNRGLKSMRVWIPYT
jgi:DUF1680 family protein